MSIDLVAATIMLPCGQDASRPDAGKGHAYTGFVLGPLFVHCFASDDGTAGLVTSTLYYDDDAWTVTHLPTGFAVQKRIPTHARAIWLARKLLELHPFDQVTADDMRSAVTSIRAEIDALREAAVSGDIGSSLAGPATQMTKAEEAEQASIRG